MRSKKLQQLYTIELIFRNAETKAEMTRRVLVRAASRETAEHRAMKRNPSAVGVTK